MIWFYHVPGKDLLRRGSREEVKELARNYGMVILLIDMDWTAAAFYSRQASHTGSEGGGAIIWIISFFTGCIRLSSLE